MIDPNTALEAGAALITAFGGGYSALRHVSLSRKIKKEAERQAILDKAKEEMAKIETALDEKIKKLEIELEAQKINVSKDLEHVREIYNAEIKTLASKIDNLRQDLSEQHANMVALLTKLVNSR